MNRLTARDDQIGCYSIRIRMTAISTEHFREILMFSQAERDQKLILSHALAPLAVMNRLALCPAWHASAPAITWILLTGSKWRAHAVRSWRQQSARMEQTRIQALGRYP
jgi:hypothetical protein